MSKKFWLKLGIWVLGVLVVLYFAFWIALFNPLEGSVGSLSAIVPGKATWYVSGPWGAIRKSELLKKHFFGSGLEAEVDSTFDLDKYLYGPIRQLEKQVNSSLPSFFGKFSVLDDLMGREVAVAGTYSSTGADLGQKLLNSPYLLLTRISFKARFMDVLKYHAVRKNIPGLEAYRDYYQYDMGPKAVRKGAPESARYVYFQRVKDVLIVSNNREMIESAVRFARAGGVSQGSLHQAYYFYYDTQGETPKDAVVAWTKVQMADNQLGGALSDIGGKETGSFTDFLKGFFPIRQTISLTLKAGVQGANRIPLAGSVRLFDDQLSPRLSGLHRTAPTNLGAAVKGWAGDLPADQTFALAYLKMSPEDFFFTIFSSLDPATRKLLIGEQKRVGKSDRWPLERLAEQLGSWFKDGVTVAWARLPEVDKIDLDTPEGGIPKPYPGMSILLTVKDNLDPGDIEDFFKRNRKQFGFEKLKEVKVPVGRMFTLGVSGDASMGLIRPAYATVGRQFLFSTNAGELKTILAVKNGTGKPLAGSANFENALKTIFTKGNIFFFVDMERARPFIRDQRWQYASDASMFNPETYRNQVIVKYAHEHSGSTIDDRQAYADKMVKERQRKADEIDFPDAIQRYEANMEWVQPFRWVALSDSPATDEGGEVRLDLRGAIELEPRGAKAGMDSR